MVEPSSDRQDENYIARSRGMWAGAFVAMCSYGPVLTVAILCGLVLHVSSLGAEETVQPDPLPEGNKGIAARYPGDVGIEEDPSVVFVEMFEVDSVEELAERWDTSPSSDKASLSDLVPPGSASSNSLLMTHVAGEGRGIGFYRRLQPGYEKLHYRFYIRLGKDAGPLHHTFRTGGYNPLTPYAVQRAGHRPPGDERFIVGVGPHYANGHWDFYTYWMEMRGSPPSGQTWGNSFLRNFDTPAKVHEQWVCAEIMIKLNDVGESNGELALWIDGELVGHLGEGFPKGKWSWGRFLKDEGGNEVLWSDEKGGRVDRRVPEGGEPFDGFRFRNDEDLLINFLWGPMVYITKAEEGHVSKIWHDHVVVAEEYIGPIMPIEDDE